MSTGESSRPTLKGGASLDHEVVLVRRHAASFRSLNANLDDSIILHVNGKYE